jgi:hypothetical protein
MKTVTRMTEKQRLAVEAMEGARSEGVSLSDYAKARGLVIRELYDAIAGLRRKGLLAQAAKRKKRSQFVAVRVAPEHALPMASTGMNIPVCRVVQPGRVIECLRWPPPNWLAALSPDRRMLRPDRGIARVYLHRAPVDMRKQIDDVVCRRESANQH